MNTQEDATLPPLGREGWVDWNDAVEGVLAADMTAGLATRRRRAGWW
jgi:hypothetical protein